MDGKECLAKPLVIFDADRIEKENLYRKGAESVIVEGHIQQGSKFTSTFSSTDLCGDARGT